MVCVVCYVVRDWLCLFKFVSNDCSYTLKSRTEVPLKFRNVVLEKGEDATYNKTKEC